MKIGLNHIALLCFNQAAVAQNRITPLSMCTRTIALYLEIRGCDGASLCYYTAMLYMYRYVHRCAASEYSSSTLIPNHYQHSYHP